MSDDSRLLTNAIAGLSGTSQPQPLEPLSPEDAMALAAFLIAELSPPATARLDIGNLKKDPREEP
jgi:hypothetical protein